MNTKIVTYTGKVFDLLNPSPDMVCIEDIAHSLAYQCRYTGHTREFYSVAQHCVLMAENPDLPGDPLQKLMHDAAEAYIGDIANPWKNLLQVQIPHLCPVNIERQFVPVRDFEAGIQKVIGLALGIDLNYSAEVKGSDIRMMATEIRDLMPQMFSFSVWCIKENNPVKEIIASWVPEFTEKVFLAVYAKLRKEKLC